MNLKEYSQKIEKTWISNEKDLVRIGFGIGGESGELLELFKKYYRGDFSEYDFYNKLEPEIGDLFYYLIMLCNYIGADSQKLLNLNIKKLQDRKNRNKIQGFGDNR